MATLKTNDVFVELYFDKTPDSAILGTLEVYKFQWNRRCHCWYAPNNEDNMIIAKSILTATNGPQKSPLYNLPKLAITMKTLLIKCHSFYCNAHHSVKDMAGEIEICNRLGQIETCLVPIAYCETCKKYYILDETYKSLKKHGIILCQIVDHKTISRVTNMQDFNKWRDHSILKDYGYSVNSSEDLSSGQRQAILERLIDNRIITKDKILSYLDFFQKYHTHSGYSAINKWKQDRHYISRYRIGQYHRVKIGKMRTIA